MASNSLDEAILARYNSVDRSNIKEFEEVMKSMCKYGQFSNSPEVQQIIENEWNVFKEQADSTLLDNFTDNELRNREEVLKNLFYSRKI